MNENLEALIQLFISVFKLTPSVSSLPGGGSSRKYYRLRTRDISVVGVYGKDVKENKCFVSLAESFLNHDVKVPEVIAVSPSSEYYLLEDLGDVSLLNMLGGEERMIWAQKAINTLVGLQSLPETAWRPFVDFPPFSSRLIDWDLNYFKYDFLKPLDLAFDEYLLQDDFDKMIRRLTTLPSSLTGFMYRDFQSRNILVHDKELFLIDFQGGREGPIVYDLISFLWQAKAKFSYEEKSSLIREYIQLTSRERKVDGKLIEDMIYPLALFRTLQVLGAYGLRGLIEKKSHFIESIPMAVANLVELKTEGALDDYPELSKIASLLEHRFFDVKENKPSGLRVTVGSFSYKKGYPEDPSGNGGGFVFDCRGLHNPGRYDEYKSLTGRDVPVIQFLEKENEVGDFIENVFKTISPTVARYIDRSFSSLQIFFGCTGGQHRSVYSAENIAKMLKKEFGDRIEVVLVHREQGIRYSL